MAMQNGASVLKAKDNSSVSLSTNELFQNRKYLWNRFVALTWFKRKIEAKSFYIISFDFRLHGKSIDFPTFPDVTLYIFNYF